MKRMLTLCMLVALAAVSAHAQVRSTEDELCDRAIDEVSASRELIAKMQAELDAAKRVIAKDAEVIAAEREAKEAYKKQADTAERLAASETRRADAEAKRADAEHARAEINDGLYKQEKKKNRGLRIQNILLKVGAAAVAVLTLIK